jgi:hypothetical protein
MCLPGRRLPTHMRIRWLWDTLECVWLCLCFGRQVGSVGDMFSLWCGNAVSVSGGVLWSK